ncbi:hypothetical protein ACFX1Q_037530 [Malus domestica]
MYKSSAASDLVSKGSDVRYYFRSWKAISHSSSHLSRYALLKAAAHLVKLWIFLKVVGDFIFRIVHIYLGCASIPCWVTRYPKNLLEDTLTVHLVGMSFILYLLKMLKVSTKLPMCSDRCLPFTMMSWT